MTRRDGEIVGIATRPVESTINAGDQPDSTHSVFEAECGKGTYLRALPRYRAPSGCYGHICA